MARTTLPFNPAEYALVADRITLFYERFPTGRIITKLISRDRDVVFLAKVYRSSSENVPAATGWASEREGDGEINLVACVENTETSAIGRALANLGFTASLKRPSYEEMHKAERARRRLGRVAEMPAPAMPAMPAMSPMPASPAKTPALPVASELDVLVDLAERAGMPAERTRTLRRLIASYAGRDDARLVRLGRRLRRWIAAHHDRTVRPA